ncbi:MAG: Serine/threonine-protein kinase PknD [Planctomycetota bacterium]
MNLDLLRRISNEVDRIEQAIAKGESIAIDELFPDLHGEDRSIAVREVQELLDELSQQPNYFIPIVSASSLSARYEPIEPINQGGMGEIWVAFDHDFNRRVAIKEILPEAAGNELLRQRFNKEAEITARLEHPGILPIYSRGFHADGRPYYSMRFISGDGTRSLHQAIHEIHHQKPQGDRFVLAHSRKNLHELLQRFIAVCNTVAYAHHANIFHCDLKPANILLGRFGETFVVDWGLAMDQSKEDSQAPDRHQRFVGTMGFIAPELFTDPSRVGPQSDIYSLGAVLYTLCVGSSPSAKANQSETEQTKQAILEGRFPKPRQLNPKLHPALEAICLKAIAVDPQFRYTTASDLAEDIARYLEDAPTIAWKEPWLYRARRWLQSNIALASSIACILLLTLVGTSIFSWLTHQQRMKLSMKSHELNRALESETKYKDEAIELAKQANHRELLAEEAVRAFWAEVAQDPQLRYSPDFVEMKRRLLARPADFYGKLSQAYLDATNRNSDALGKSVDARLELSKLQLEGGEFQEAQKNLEQVLESIDGKPNDSSLEEPQWIYRKLLALSTLANIHRKLGQSQKSQEFMNRFATIKEELSDKSVLPASIEIILIENDMMSSLEHANRNERKQSEKFANTAMDRLNSLVERFPEDQQYTILREQLLSDEALCYLRLGDPQMAQAKWKELLNIMTAALSKQTPASNTGESESAKSEALKDPDQFNRQFRLAAVTFNLGDAALFSGQIPQAQKYHQKALALRKKLAEELPLVAEFQWTLAHSYQAVSRIAQLQNDIDQAIIYQRQGCEIARRLHDRIPTSPRCKSELIALLHQLGHLESQAGNRQKAADAYREALPLATAILAGNSTDDIMRRHRFEMAEHLGGILFLDDQFDEANEQFELSLKDAEGYATRPESLPKDRALYRSILDRMELISKKGADR